MPTEKDKTKAGTKSTSKSTPKKRYLSPGARRYGEGKYDEVIRDAMQYLQVSNPGGVLPPEWREEAKKDKGAPADPTKTQDQEPEGGRFSPDVGEIDRRSDVVNLDEGGLIDAMMGQNRQDPPLGHTEHGGVEAWSFPRDWGSGKSDYVYKPGTDREKHAREHGVSPADPHASTTREGYEDYEQGEATGRQANDKPTPDFMPDASPPDRLAMWEALTPEQKEAIIAVSAAPAKMKPPE